MGRRARTNCSPVDSALEKYHNDIGNRLSGIFVPPHPCPANNEESPCDAFSMLTLDFRGKHAVKQHNTTATSLPTTACQKSATMPNLLNNTKDNNNNKNIIEESDETDSQKDDSAFGHIITTSNNTSSDIRSNTLPSFNSQQNDFSAVSSLKEKRNIMDKLARAIFQRKHTCARCQRKSRSCLQNKTFNVSEKHYTCGRCRETSRAFKNLISGQDSKSTNNTDSDSGSSSISNNNNDISKNNADIILRKPRIQLKDSGYETVTSCSTVASSHSNSNSPYASSNKHNFEDSHNSTAATTATTPPQCLRGETVTPSQVDAEVDELIRRADKGLRTTPFYTGGRGPAHLNNNNNNNNTSDYVNTNNLTNAGIEQYLGVAGGDGCRVLKQVKTRYVQNYDGYLNLPVSSHNDDHHHPHDGYCNCGDDFNSNEGDFTTSTQASQSKPSPRMCHICETTSRPCFRLPWEGGWLCEECIDGML